MSIGDFGSSQVTVKKAQLIERMKKNLEAHRALFLKAQEG
jgi:hypothetical protein